MKRRTCLFLCICASVSLLLFGCSGDHSAQESDSERDVIGSQIESQATQPVQDESLEPTESSEVENSRADATEESANESRTEEASAEQVADRPQSKPEATAAAASPSVQNDLGAFAPDAALAYMQTTDNLVIVDVAAVRWYNEQHFEGAINIPIEELNSDERDVLYMEIPSDRPVLLHCRRGVIVPGAYRRVKGLRPEIPEIAYIDGMPPFDEYNT